MHSPVDRRRAGFSLIEMVVVLSLMALAAGAVAPMALRQLTGNRQKTALDGMRQVVEGMLGDPAAPGDFGYLGDMGRLPDALSDLNQRGAQTPYAIDPSYGIGAGYNGPYVRRAGPGNAALVDPWGLAFQYTPGIPQLTSAGPDRQFGSADDLLYPAAPPPLTANLVVDVLGIPNDGGPPLNLTPAEVSVFLSSSVDGVRLESPLAGTGPFTSAAPVASGYHGLLVVGVGSYSGATARQVVALHRGTLAVDVALTQPPGVGPLPGPLDDAAEDDDETEDEGEKEKKEKKDKDEKEKKDKKKDDDD